MTPKERKEVLDRAESEVTAFEVWFQSTGASPLAKFEKAILKSYIIAKMTNKFDVESHNEILDPCRAT